MVKGNQPALLAKVSAAFITESRTDMPRFAHLDIRHGRVVSQLTWTASATQAAIDRQEWPQCKTIAMVASLRQVGGKTSDLEPLQPIDRKRLFQGATTMAVARLRCRIPQCCRRHADLRLESALSSIPLQFS